MNEKKSFDTLVIRYKPGLAEAVGARTVGGQANRRADIRQ